MDQSVAAYFASGENVKNRKKSEKLLTTDSTFAMIYESVVRQGSRISVPETLLN